MATGGKGAASTSTISEGTLLGAVKSEGNKHQSQRREL
jgi:hypothetical protein